MGCSLLTIVVAPPILTNATLLPLVIIHEIAEPVRARRERQRGKCGAVQ